MSLLLEALKKAELAKQGAKSAPAESPASEPIITRSALPDITQPLEILANDLPSATTPEESQTAVTQGAPLELAPSASRPLEDLLGATASASSTGSDSSMDRGTESIAAEPARAAARQVFEVKEMDYNPRRPFYITLSLLGLCAVGYGGYVWWQMQPRSMYNAAAVAAAKKTGPDPTANPAPPVAAPVTAGQAPAAPANTAPAPAGVAQQAAQAPAAPAPITAAGGPAKAAPTTGAQSVPVTAKAAPAQTATRPANATATTAAPRTARPSAPRTAAQSQDRQGSSSPISITPPGSTVDPQTEQAYQAFQQGNLAVSRDLYQRGLQREPSNRDALLGLAAIDTRTRDYDTAEMRYLRLLEIDPRDPHALAGIVALRGQTDPVQSESRLKTLLSAQPDVAHLHFALGNQYAAQSRWPEAQAAYFKAYSLEPDNPDFAFNLAVGLDRLRQTKPALDYYQRALSLAGTRSAGFDKSIAATRIKELSRP
jgi:Flp pilus assembly protein TadD